MIKEPNKARQADSAASPSLHLRQWRGAAALGRSTMKLRVAATIFCLWVGLPIHAQQTQSEFTAPSGQHSIKLIPASTESEPDRGELKLCAGQKILASYTVIGYITEVFWSPEDKYVALENRWANGGDYVWVFHLNDGAVVKRPDELQSDPQVAYGLNALIQRIKQKLPEYKKGGFYKRTTHFVSWKSASDFELESIVGFTHVGDSYADVLDTYHISKTRLSLLDSKIEKKEMNSSNNSRQTDSGASPFPKLRHWPGAAAL